MLRLYAWLIAALAHHGLGRLDLASQALGQALALAASEGFRRPFVVAFPLRRLLERHLGRPTDYGPLVAASMWPTRSASGATRSLIGSHPERVVIIRDV